MKNQNNNRKKGILKTLAYGATGLAILAGVSILPNKNLKPENFEKANWIEYNNPNGIIWGCYTNEDIPKNQSNWHLYIEQTREKNNGNLEGTILLPDLDGNGIVGK
ncbi:MAG TPA: hypothetical protein VMV95_02740 [Bacillota bacterium]|nr:hypothetical protein [Bacillota bacterium]